MVPNATGQLISGWIPFNIVPPNFPLPFPIHQMMTESLLKYYSFLVPPGPDYDWKTFDFDTDPLEITYKNDAMSRDLSSRNLGGRGEIFVPVDMGVAGRRSVENEPEASRLLITKIAHIRKGRSIPPHGHSNMVSAFLCVSGRFDVRLYDKLEDRENEMVVRQTLEQKDAKPGSWSSISDYRNNVHWLTAKSDDCFLFTTKLIRLEEDRESRGRVNIDVNQGTRLGSNTYCAAKITPREAAEKY